MIDKRKTRVLKSTLIGGLILLLGPSWAEIWALISLIAKLVN